MAAKENDGKLGVGVFQREIDVAGGRRAEVGDFSFDPDVAVVLFHQFADPGDQIAHGPDVAGVAWFLEFEVELRRKWLARSHSIEFNWAGARRRCLSSSGFSIFDHRTDFRSH